jgi:hypothetical protein
MWVMPVAIVLFPVLACLEMLALYVLVKAGVWLGLGEIVGTGALIAFPFAMIGAAILSFSIAKRVCPPA